MLGLSRCTRHLQRHRSSSQCSYPALRSARSKRGRESLGRLGARGRCSTRAERREATGACEHSIFVSMTPLAIVRPSLARNLRHIAVLDLDELALGILALVSVEPPHGICHLTKRYGTRVAELFRASRSAPAAKGACKRVFVS